MAFGHSDRRISNKLKRRFAKLPDTKLIYVMRDLNTTMYHSDALRGVANDLAGRATDIEPQPVVLYLEAAQHVNEPDLVRSSIEFNPDMILAATRHFQWDDENYRVDGIYGPARMPVAAPIKREAHWDHPLSTAPAWMWSSRVMWRDAPFTIVDRTYMNPANRINDGVPKLAPTRGRLFA